MDLRWSLDEIYSGFNSEEYKKDLLDIDKYI